MGATVVRIQEKGQVTIPQEIRRKLNLKKGDLVTFVETERGIVIQPAAIVINAALDEIGRALKQSGVTLEQAIERGREIRGELIEQEYHLTERSNRRR